MPILAQLAAAPCKPLIRPCLSTRRLRINQRGSGAILRASSDGNADVSGGDIPTSLEESVGNACEALRTVLGSGKSGKRKKKRKASQAAPKSLRRLVVEVPVLDTSSQTLGYLASALAQELSTGGPVSVVFTGKDVEDLPQDVPYVSVLVNLEGAAVAELTNRLVVVAPEEECMAGVLELVSEVWRGEVVVLLSPQWGKDPSEELEGFKRTFDVVYSYLPLAMQGLLGKKEGALLKWVKEKNATAKWKIFVKEGDGEFKCVGQQVERPKDEDLELAMYNASAAESPVTKGIQFLRNLTAGQK